MMRRVALITGGSRGIGFGCAKALAREGFDLAINGLREEERVAEPLDELRGMGAEVLYCRGDIGNRDDRATILDGIRKRLGRLHVLVNNAGMPARQRVDLLEAGEESYDQVMNVNLKGAYFLTQAAARWMVEQREADAGFAGCVIFMSSVSATMASINRGEYCLAKAGLAMATKLFATRLGPEGIPVYEVRPGVTKTDMTGSPEVTAKYDKMIEEGLCVTPRWGQPEDVGLAVASLARGDFPYSTGQVVMVDGGMTVPRL